MQTINHSLPFRQVHLDFHTSGLIPEVGCAFDKNEFQKTLKDAAVDSITCFSVCHHGYHYHPTMIGRMHPTLKIDLLRAQIDAAHEIGIRVPVYISAGGNEVCALVHPEWREVTPPGVSGWSSQSLFDPGFHKLCFNTPYLDHLCKIIDETMTLFPDADGLFFDIIGQWQCCCPACMSDMFSLGMDPKSSADRIAFCQKVVARYYERVNAVVQERNPAMPVFHNSGGIDMSRPELLQQYFTHLELESLPTGGWGYDHFPLSAGFARKTGMKFVGMTGKFHRSWGEFGGFKHPNALRYECALALANGAGISVGDQLHPNARLDESTYRIVGEAFREVREKEKYCRNAVNRAEIALISAAACGLEQSWDFDIGASRFLLESHFLFDVLHPDMDFSKYALVIFPEQMSFDADLTQRVDQYLESGGQIVLAGNCLCRAPFETGADIGKNAPHSVSYILPAPPYRPEFITSPCVIYSPGVRMHVTGGESLGQVYDPYFDRSLEHFCSHSQTPNDSKSSGFDFGSLSAHGAFIAYPVFSEYRKNGAVVLRITLEKLIDALLGEHRLIRTNLPSTARVFVTTDISAKREIVHLLFAPIIKRGMDTEIIEDLTPLCNINLSFRPSFAVRRCCLVPENRPLAMETSKDGTVHVRLSEFTCHAMIAFEE